MQASRARTAAELEDRYLVEVLEVALGLELLDPDELKQLLDRPARRTRRTRWLSSPSRV